MGASHSGELCAFPLPQPLLSPPSSSTVPLPPGLGEAGLVLDARCNIAPAALEALRAGERCDGSGGVADARGNASSIGDGAWGLPALGCPAPPRELLNSYPVRHAMLAREGRVMQYCYHAPLGNYLEALPAAFLLSLLLDLALIVHCDVRRGDHMAQFRTKVASVLPHYFRGPHIDWSSRVILPHNASDLHQPQGAFPQILRAPTGLRAQLNIRAQTEAVLAHPANRARLRAALGTGLAQHANLPGCLLRYLLAPSVRLEALVAAVPHHPRPSLDGQSLRSVAMHVRLGDHFLGATRGKDADSRSIAYQRNPIRAMRCLMRAAAERGHAGAERSSDEACLQAVVISDSGWVERCARRVLRSVAISPGVALHPHKSAGRALSDGAVDKLMVDWWLLARSRGLVSFVDGSSFSRLARAFRDASDPLGWSLELGRELGPDPAVCEQPRPTERARADWTRSPLRAPYCAAAAQLGCATRGLCARIGAPLTGEGPLAALVVVVAAVCVALSRIWRRAIAPHITQRLARAQAADESELAPFLRADEVDAET